MDKSADAFRTISEVADHLDTPAHVLRFWESRFPQIRPVKRAGGRRYYRPSDVALLTGIKRLLHDEGMTIRGVQKILREQGVRHVSGVTGDAPDHDGVDDAAYSDMIDDAVVTMPPDPTPFRPAPGLTEAMAKAVDLRPGRSWPEAPTTAVPIVKPEIGAATGGNPDSSEAEPVAPALIETARVEPVQGALLLMPALQVESDAGDSQTVADLDDDATNSADIADIVRVSQLVDDTEINAPSFEVASFPETTADISDFDDDDFDDVPIQTLASRIRALPQGASAAKVGADLLGVMARLQTLRDAVAEAAQTGRA